MLTALNPKLDVQSNVPLVVDLDGTLIRSDLLVESVFAALGADPLAALELLAAWLKGRAALKECAARLGRVDPATLPYDTEVLKLIEEARASGRPVYLASASSERLLKGVAEHLGVFDGWFASNGDTNLKAEKKAERLVEEFGHKAFDYVGNDHADLPVWKHARRAYAIRPPRDVESLLASQNADATILPSVTPGWRAWLKLLRVHQYAKNLLVLVPLVAAHTLSSGSIVNAALAFIAFSLCASGVYILNDLADLAADRAHPSKKNRPLANGSVPIIQAAILAPVLLLAAFAVASTINRYFVVMLGIYLGLTTAYTFWLKRKMLLDAVTLAALYTLRVIGGATAIAVPVSRWLLAFSLFIFMALALVKRYVELARLLDRGLPNPANRGYEKGDLLVIASLAAAAGYNAVIVLALYVSSDTVTGLYRRPEMLWFVCPIVMYWISRLLLKAHRRVIDDDPVVFALKDPVSLCVAGIIALLGTLAL